MASTKPTAPLTALQRLQEAFKVPNATFDAKAPSDKELNSMKMVRAMSFSIDYFFETGRRYNMTFNGAPGTGKTSFGKMMATANGLDYVYVNCANTDQENWGLPIIVKDEDGTESIQWAILRSLDNDRPKVLIIDELGQSDPGFLSALMEVMSEGSIGGVPVKNLVSIWVFDNPSNNLNGDLNEADLAQADRGGNLFLLPSDTPWKHGLALRFPELDLKKVFSFYDNLPLSATGREILNPRVLEHVINALRLGFNGQYGLPIMNDRYVAIPNTTGEDMADVVIDGIAKALGLPNPGKSVNDYDRAVSIMADEGLDIIAYGTQGTGKTSRAKASLAKLGVHVAYKSVPVISKEDVNLSVTSADNKYVDVITHSDFMKKKPTVGIFDEITRGTRRTMNALMEIIQEHTSGGQALPGYKGTLMLTNLAKAGEQDMDVEEVSLPFATRPDLNFILSVDDLHSMEWLVETYGDEIVPFTEWWRMDIDEKPEYKILASPRFLERAFHFYKGGLEIEWALPAPHGEYVPVPLVKLLARLGGAPVISFLNLVEETEDYVNRLAERDANTNTPVDTTLHIAVATALMNAELATLKPNKAVCVAVYRVLAEQWQITLMRNGNPEKWHFWSEVLAKAFPES